MADVIFDFLESLLDRSITQTGRWVPSLFGLQSNVVAETVLRLLVWILVILLALARLAALV